MDAIEIDWLEEITEEDYKEFLNDNYPTVDICGMTMNQGDILFEMDNIAFRESYNNHIDAEERDQGSFKCGACDSMHCYKEEAEECCQEEEE